MTSYIFLDNNATTSPAPEVIEAMEEELKKPPSNPSSIHQLGKQAKQRLEHGRDTIAKYLQIKNKELIFTSGATEGLHLAILGLRPRGKIISTAIEHAAIYETLKKPHFRTHFLQVDSEGMISLDALEKAITKEEDLLVIGSANSETGIIHPIEEIARIAQKQKISLIVDHVGSFGKAPIALYDGITAATFSSHKIHGPQGVGALFIRENTPFSSYFGKGTQEWGKRSGTENLPGIVGFAKAVELLKNEISIFSKISKLRDDFEKRLQEAIPTLVIHGQRQQRVCNTSSIYFPRISGEELLILLDLQKICVSMGSACSSGSVTPSRVLLQMGKSAEIALSTLRFSLSRYTTQEEISKAVTTIVSLISQINTLR